MERDTTASWRERGNMRRSILKIARIGSRIGSGTPVVPSTPPHEVDMAKYAPLFADFNTVPEIWNSTNLTDAWATLYRTARELSSNEDDLHRLRSLDTFGLARLSSNLEVSRVLLILPQVHRDDISKHPDFKLSSLEEVFFHVGMPIEVRGHGFTFTVGLPTIEDVIYVQKRVASFGSDGRSTIPGTLHRISAFHDKNRKVVGITVRIGKYIPNAARALAPLVKFGNLLLLSRPSIGKTTLLRDLAVQVSQMPGLPRVVVIDTSCEIGGDSSNPLPFMGRVRRVFVKDRKKQSEAMLEALQNHSPDYIIVDEVSNLEEAEAAFTISQRGVKLIATCHAHSLNALIHNNQINKLVGGVSQAFLSNEERRLKGKLKKSVLERPVDSPFTFVCEMPSRSLGILYTNVNQAVDRLLDEDGSYKNLGHCRFEIDLTKDLPIQAKRSYETKMRPLDTDQMKDKEDNEQMW